MEKFIKLIQLKILLKHRNHIIKCKKFAEIYYQFPISSIKVSFKNNLLHML